MLLGVGGAWCIIAFKRMRCPSVKRAPFTLVVGAVFEVTQGRELEYPLKSLSRSRARGFLRDEFGVLLVEFSLIRTMD